MTIKDSIEKSVKPFTIFVVKEALFCTVYEQSAWRFAHAVRPNKSVKKFVKKLGSEVVSDWRADYPLREAISSIEDAIRSYNVADHTPMQCMQFIIDLQNKIKLVRKMPE